MTNKLYYSKEVVELGSLSRVQKAQSMLGVFMGKQDILKILRLYKKEVANEYKISKIGIFGSTARGEANYESDIDIVISVLEPDFFMLAGIKTDLEDRLEKPVDIVTYTDTMNSLLKKRIDREAVYA